MFHENTVKLKSISDLLKLCLNFWFRTINTFLGKWEKIDFLHKSANGNIVDLFKTEYF